MNVSLIKKIFRISSAFIIYFLFVFASHKINPLLPVVPEVVSDRSVCSETAVKSTLSLYDSLNLRELGLSRQAYDFAMTGFMRLRASKRISNDKVISIVDFSLASSKKRLFIIDLENQTLLFHTYVSHGRNSGKDRASQFSNEDGSFKSSLGFYVTLDTYAGKHGYSMRLGGEERGINDHALSRGIVMHSAAYVNENVVRAQGYLGRSQGCPAVPESLHKKIIEKIKSGSCFFMYSPDTYYVSHSNLLRPAV